MTNENKKEENNEQQVVTLADFKPFADNSYFERFFECKKCGSSIICLSDEYSKNNITNSIEDNPMNCEKLVLCCGNCNHKDLLLKFLKERQRQEILKPYDDGLIEPRPLLRPRRRYYSNNRPYTMEEANELQ